VKNNIKLISVIFIIIVTLFLSTLIMGEKTAEGKRRLIIIFDASYSMQDKLSGDVKIELAKNTISAILQTYPLKDVGLIVYGHRYSSTDSKSCEDIELVKDFTNENVDMDKINNLSGNGKTPISEALIFASKYFHPEKQNHIILLSDGIDTCGGNPCDTIRKLEREHGNIKVDTVGFTLSETDKSMLDCISDSTGGSFYSAYSLPELRDGITGFFYEIDPETGVPKVEEEPEEEEKEDEFVFIEGGMFIMGDTNRLKKDEAPEHDVFVQSFMMKETEVTNEEYAEFLNEAGFNPKWIDIDKALIEYKNDKYTPVSGAEDLPAVFVTWYGADAYAKYYGGRLPTEAEWEYAAYGGNYERKYPWGDEEFIEGNKMAHYDYSRTDIFSLKDSLKAVGSFEKNEYGLYDIAGNVWEWCEDWYGEDYYSESETYVPRGPIEGKYKVRRGGSFFNNEITIRVTNRGYARPSGAFRDTGFRYVIPIIPDSLKEE
jgi:formylglycine-generating enzyme required for sulfatase activity